MASILEKIAIYKRRETAAAKAVRSIADVEAAARVAPSPRPFRAALAGRIAEGRSALIAEIKKASPSKGLIRADFDPPALARAYATGGAVCLSVLTDGPSFQGSDNDLVAARGATILPALRKDFMFEPYQIAQSRALGADCVLVILAAVDDDAAGELIASARGYGMDALIEVHNEVELARAAALGADLIGINNRDLHTFATTLETSERLSRLVPPGALVVSESGIATASDIARLRACGIGAFLVGESLMREADVAIATRRLLGPVGRTAAAVGA